MALENLIVGEFNVYVGASGAAHDTDLNPVGNAAWALLGSGWHQGGNGIRHTIGRTYNDVFIENEVDPIDSFLDRAPQTLELMLQDFSAEALAWAIHGGQTRQTNTAAGSGVAGSQDVSLELVTDVEKFALVVVGPSPILVSGGNTGPFRSNIYWPLCRPEGDWETTLMRSQEGRHPFRVRKLKHATIDAKLFLQNADPS